MTCTGFQKWTQYPHVSDCTNEPAKNSADSYKLYNIHPVINMVQESFARSYKHGEN